MLTPPSSARTEFGESPVIAATRKLVANASGSRVARRWTDTKATALICAMVAPLLSWHSSPVHWGRPEG